MSIDLITEANNTIAEKSKRITEQENIMRNLKLRLTIKEEQLRQKDEEIRIITEEKIGQIIKQDREIKDLNDVIKEQYKFINQLTHG